jgi:hypothetical protein
VMKRDPCYPKAGSVSHSSQAPARGGHSGVTIVLPCRCYKGVIMLLQWSYDGVKRVLQWCDKSATKDSRGRANSVSKV